MDMQIQLFNLMGAAPMFLVWGAGILACVRQSRNRPKACLLTAVAIGLAVFTRLVLPYISTFFFQLALPGVDDISLRVLINSFVFSVPSAISSAIMLWVIFGLKENHAEPYGQDWQLPR